MEKNYDYTNIIHIKKAKSDYEVNKLLELGWVLLEMCKVDYGHPTREDYSIDYILGWNKENGDIKHGNWY